MISAPVLPDKNFAVKKNYNFFPEKLPPWYCNQAKKILMNDSSSLDVGKSF